MDNARQLHLVEDADASLDQISRDRLRFRRHSLPVGGDEIHLLVASEGGEPSAVFMSYEAFLELAATMFTAIEALKAAGVDPDEVLAPIE